MTKTSIKQMHVAVLTGPGRVELQKAPMPEPGPGEVRVRLEGCGVCGSNFPVWEGRPWFSYPQEAGAPGHEGWGIVDAIGDGVGNFFKGQRVSLISYHAFAEYDKAPAESLIALPEELDGMPCPGEPLGCAMNVFRRSGIEAGQTVAIVGIGFLGALVTSLASRAGAKVIAISRRPFAREMAARLGANVTFPMEDPAATAGQVRELTGGRGCDVVIEATGFQEPLDLGTNLTCERGRLVIAGFHQDGPRQVNMQTWNWLGLDVINAHERDPAVYVEGTRAAFRALAEGRLDPVPLFTDMYPLDQLNRAFTAMRDRKPGMMKACVTMS